MACALSQRNKSIKNEEIDDPILNFLDQIRSEYCSFKKEKDDIINALQITNLNLTKTLNNLNDELNCTYGNGSPINTDNKRRKTASSDDSDLDSAKLFGRITILDSDSDSALSLASSKNLSSVIDRIKSTQNKSAQNKSTVSSSDDSDFERAKLFSRINLLDSSSSRSTSEKSIDNDVLNIAINDDDNIILDDSEIFFPPTQTTNLQTTPKRKTPESHNKILSPINKNVIKEQQQTPIKNEPTTPPLMKKLQLPKRMKSTLIPTKNNPSTSKNNENKNPSKCDGWISKNQICEKNKNNNWNMSFRQPVVKTKGNDLNSSGEVIACSQDVARKQKKDRNKPSLKHSPKLRQAKLEFDLKIEKKDELNLSKNENNETFCDDIIGASPTCTNSLTSKDSKLTRTLRKFTRNKSDDDLFVFPMKKSLSNESLTTTTTKSNSKELYNRPTISTKKKLTLTTTPKKEIEPTEQERYRLQRQFFEHMLTDDSIKGLVTIIDNEDSIINTSIRSNKDTTAKKMLDNDSSLFILPSQPDDVIFVDDTDQCDYNLSSMDLLEEMMKDDKDTQPLLKKFEAEQIKSLQCTGDNNKKSSSSSTVTPPQSRLQLPQQNKTKAIIDDDETKLSEIFDDKNDFTTTSLKTVEPKGFHPDCDECRKHRKYLISQNVPPDEIEKRLRTCKKPQKLHNTPDGFWDPRFREFPPGDPRNEVLIDYRFVNKNKEKK